MAEPSPFIATSWCPNAAPILLVAALGFSLGFFLGALLSRTRPAKDDDNA